MTSGNIFRYLKEKRRFIAYTMIRLITTAIGFLVNIFIVRKLSLGGYGAYSLAILVVGFATTFGFTWSSSSILYFGSREKAESNSINKTFWARNLLLALGLIFITGYFILFKDSINHFAGEKIALNILVWIYIQVVVDFLNQYFLAIQKQLAACIMYFTAKSTLLLFIIFFRIETSLDIINLNILTDSIMLLFIFRINKRDLGKPVFDKQYFKDILFFSLWQLFGFAGLFLTNFGDNLVIKYFLSNEDIGIYNSAYKLFSAFGDLSYLIVNFYGAYIIENLKKKNKDKLKSFFYKDRTILCAIIIAIHIIIIYFCRPIISLIYGGRYLSSVPILRTLLIGSAARYLTVFYIPFCNATKGYVELQILNIVQAVLNIVLDIVLVKHFGVIGAAFATVAAVLITGVFLIIRYERKINKAIICISE